jgi:hypothetical protein
LAFSEAGGARFWASEQRLQRSATIHWS